MGISVNCNWIRIILLLYLLVPMQSVSFVVTIMPGEEGTLLMCKQQQTSHMLCVSFTLYLPCSKLGSGLRNSDETTIAVAMTYSLDLNNFKNLPIFLCPLEEESCE